jgi:hypothetical protein
MFEFIKKLFRPRAAQGVFVGRHRTRDISFLAQSAIGFIGRLTRSVPAPKVTPNINDATNPVLFFGLACLATAANTVRSILATDSAITAIFGIAVEPFPFQISSGTNFGAQPLSALTSVPTPGFGAPPLDVNNSGFQTVYCNSAQAPTATRVSPVCVWIAASTGTHVQGGFETAPAATVASVAGANTGTGTLGALAVTAGVAQSGAYNVKLTGATTFSVVDPSGQALANGTTGVAYSDDGVAFTITAGGTAFVAGDSFTVTVTNQAVQLAGNSYFNGPGDSTGAIELAFNL